MNQSPWTGSIVMIHSRISTMASSCDVSFNIYNLRNAFHYGMWSSMTPLREPYSATYFTNIIVVPA